RCVWRHSPGPARRKPVGDGKLGSTLISELHPQLHTSTARDDVDILTSLSQKSLCPDCRSRVCMYHPSLDKNQRPLWIFSDTIHPPPSVTDHRGLGNPHPDFAFYKSRGKRRFLCLDG
ncbi:hypothetical protein RRG08_006181, partial [Elysia crispata]